MSRLSMKDGRIVLDDQSEKPKSTTQKTSANDSRLSMVDGRIVLADRAPVNTAKNQSYLQRTQKAQQEYLAMDDYTPQRRSSNVMEMAINSLRNRLANSTAGNATREWASRMSNTYQTIANETPVERARRQQARIDRAALIDQIPDNVSEARRQQWAIDNAQLIDQASSMYEGPTRTERVRGRNYDTSGADMFSNDWEPGAMQEYDYLRTVRNERYNPLSREDRDDLINRYADAVNGNVDANTYQQILYDVTKNGGIEQLYREQQSDAANDREYGRQLRGVDLDSMNIWQRIGGTLGGVAAASGEQIASSGLGLVASGLNREASIATREYGPALEQTARRWFYGLVNGADDPSVEEQIRTVASYAGVDGDALINRIRDRAEQAKNSDEDVAVFAYGLLDGLEADQDKIWENAQQAISEAGFYDAINKLQQKSAENIQYAKDVNPLQNSFGDNLVEAGVSTIQNAADAAMAAALGLSGTGVVAMIPFALRVYGGSYAEQMQQATELGGMIGQDVAKRAATSAGMSSAIEVGTEMMWGMVGAMSKVTGGGALDDAAQERLTEVLSGWAKTEKGRKVLTFIGEKALGGVTEGLEEVIGDAAEQMLKNAGIMPGEADEFSEWVKNAGHSFVTGALGGLLGETTSIVMSPMQKANIGQQVRNGTLDVNLNDLVDMANAEGMENSALAKTYSELFKGMPRSVESLSNYEVGKLYDAYGETITRSDEAIERLREMVAKVESGEELKRSDVNKITNNPEVVQQLQEAAGGELNLGGNINERRAAVEMALRAFANGAESANQAQAENVHAATENASTPILQRQMDYNAMMAAARGIRQNTAAEDVRNSLRTEQSLRDNVISSARSVYNAAERLGASDQAQDVMAQMYSPGQNTIDYAGKMTSIYNRAKAGDSLDVSNLDGITMQQAQAVHNVGRMEYLQEEAKNGEESGLRVRNGLQGNDSQSAGGQTEGVEGTSGSIELRESTAGFERRRPVSGVYSQPVSAASLGIRGGSENRNIRVLTNSNDKAVQRAQQLIESRGYKAVLFTGGALEINGEQARGYYDPETNTIYVRADHRLFTAEQIAQHEVMHDRIRNGEVDLSAVKDDMIKRLGGTERFERTMRDYYALYEKTGMSFAQIFEEAVCDAAGNMNEFLYHGHWNDANAAVSFYKTARESAKATEKEGEEKKTTATKRVDSFSRDIVVGMSDDERYKILKNVRIVPAKAVSSYTQQVDSIEDLESMAKSQAEEVIYPLAERLGILNRTMRTPDLDVDFIFSKNGGLSESLSKQQRYGGTYSDFAKALVNLDGILNGAQLIEKHTDKYAGTRRENSQLQDVSVLLGAFEDGDSIIPVQIEIKTYRSQGGRLYMTVALTKIKKADVLGSGANNREQTLLPASGYSLQDIVSKINTIDADFLKYIPDQMLSNEQIEAKRNALARDAARIDFYKKFGDSGEYNSEAGGSFSRELNPDKLRELENGKTMTVYRSMQVIDGKLYPPMAAKIDDGSGKRKLVEPTDLNVWYKADEHPELLDKDGKFKLDKAQGSTLDVAYNPYWHTSNMMLNDQFSGAYDRPNLVTVECEIPVSELTSGYKAQYAKDSVGLTPWHSGPVASQLGNAGNQRNVYLSRWVKVKRIVPDSEVAKSIAKTLKGTGISVPVNTVTPSLRSELEKIGVPISEASGLNKKTAAKLNATLAKVETTFDANTESAAPTGSFSRDTWNESEYVTERNKAAKELAAALGVTQKKAKEYIDNINGIAKMIGDDAVRLDYKSSPGRSSFVSNAEYGGSFDFSTLCKKRRLMTGTMTAIQNALPNTVLTPVDFLHIRNMMLDAGLEASCGLCYVEGSRAGMGQFTKEFIQLYKKYNPGKWAPTQAEMSTPDSIEEVRLNHPEVYAEYENFWNNHGKLRESDPNLFASQQKPKLYQLRTAYNGETLKYFKKDSTIDTKNRNGGVRMQSFSDFEIVHLIDTMQIIMDMSRVGLAGQAYTKVPDFALALGNTGLKINLSLITKGVDANGKLIFDDREGMNHETAFKIRDQYSKNVGTILVTFTDDQLKAAMADDRIDFIIPFHRSQWKKSQYAAMGLPANTKDYTYQQNEKWLDQSKHRHEWRGKMVDTKVKNYMPNEWWQPNLSGKENAEYYLEMCAKDGKRPKFYKFLDYYDGRYHLKKDGSTDGYWKLLIDFKMYDNDGVFSPQTPVRPDFNMGEANRMLNSYEGGHEHFPVAQGIVDDFVKEYKESHKGGKLSRDLDSDGNNLSEQQAEYFKNSKVRDADGNLMVLYHGTNSPGFTVFDPSKSDDKTSLFFTSNPRMANTYTRLQTEGRDLDVFNLITEDSSAEDFNKAAKKNGSPFRVIKITPEWLEKRRGQYVSAMDELRPYISDLIESIDGMGDDLSAWQRTALQEMQNGKNSKDTIDTIRNILWNGGQYFGYRTKEQRAAHKRFTGIEKAIRPILDKASRYAIANEVPDSAVGNYIYEAEKPFKDVEYEIGTRDRGFSGGPAYGTEKEAIENVLSRIYYLPEHTLGNRYKVYLNVTNPFVIEGGEKIEGNYNVSAYVSYDDDITFSFLDPDTGELVWESVIGESDDMKNRVIELIGDEAFKRFDDALQENQGDPGRYEIGSAYINTVIPGRWNNLTLNGEMGKKTRDVVKWAKEQGHDGVIFNNIKDTGGWSGGFDPGQGTVVVAFDSNQVKSVDNKTPTENPDIRFSRDLTNTELYDANRQLQKDLTELRRQLKTKTEQYKYWKGQTKVTEGRKLRIEDVTKLAREIIKGQESNADAKLIAQSMKDLGEYLLNSQDEDVYEEARMKAYAIAHDILSQAKVLNSKGGEEFYRDFRSLLKGYNIYVAPSVREELAPDGWNDFRKSLFGTVNMTADQNKGTSIDQVYTDLQKQFGDWLLPEYIANEADQLNRILEVIETYRPVYENLNSYDMADAVEWTANEILTRIIGNEIRETNPTYADRMEKKLADQKMKTQDALRKVRENRDQKVASLKAHYQQMAEDRRNRKIDSEARTRLLNIAKRLKNKKLPRVTRALLDQYIGDLDLVSKGIMGWKVKELETLQAWYDSYKASMGEDFIPDRFIEEKIARLSKKHISDLTQEEVADLTTVLLNIENMIRTENELIESKIKMDTYAAGVQTIDDINNSNGKTGFLNKFISTETATPEREIHRITGYRENSPLYQAAKELSDGQRKMLDYQMRAEALFKKWTTDKKFIQSIAGKKAEAIIVKGYVDGAMQDVVITPAMRMALYLHSKNDDNMRHIAKGGVKIPNMSLYVKGKIQEAYDKADRVVFTRGMINEIAAHMSDKERAFADAVDRYYNGMSRNEINDTSEALRGYAIAGVDHYYPIDTDGSFLKKEFDAIKRDGSIEGMGILKERIEGATNPIMLYDMNDTLNRSISQHSKYVGLAIPVRNFNKLYSVTTFNYETSVAETLKKNWGSDATKYVEKMMADLQNGTGLASDSWGDLLARARSHYAGAVLTTNASVALKQTASYPTAAAVVGYGPLLKALKDNNRKADLDLIAKYTPLLWYRSKGFSTTELGDIGKEGGHIPKALNWIQGMDVWTTRKLWLAAEYYVESNNRALARGTDAYYKEVGNVYNRIIEETQPNYTMMQRPQILRSDNALTRALNMFKTQPFQNFNILYDAFGNLAAKSREYKANATQENLQALKSARTNVARAVSSQVVSAFVFALMQFAWDAFRGKAKKYKDDDEEMTFASWLKGMGINVLSSVGGMIPFGSYALELGEAMTDAILKGVKLDPFFDQTFYGLSENAADSMNDMGNAILNTITQTSKALQGESTTETTVRSLVDSAANIAQFAGVPVNNVLKLAQSIARNVFLATDGKYIGGFEALRVTTDPSKYKSDYYNLLRKAWENDQTAFNEIRKRMIDLPGDPFATSSKTAEENIDAKVKEWRKETTSQDSFYGTIYDGLTGSALWDEADPDQQNKALNQLLSLALEMGVEGSDKAGAKSKAAIDGGASVGLDATEYMLYQLALSMANSDGGTAKNSEYEEAIRMVPGLSNAERSYLWSTTHSSDKNNPWK